MEMRYSKSDPEIPYTVVNLHYTQPVSFYCLDDHLNIAYRYFDVQLRRLWENDYTVHLRIIVSGMSRSTHLRPVTYPTQKQFFSRRLTQLIHNDMCIAFGRKPPHPIQDPTTTGELNLVQRKKPITNEKNLVTSDPQTHSTSPVIHFTDSLTLFEQETLRPHSNSEIISIIKP
jgi:hypothetical protein